LHENRPISLYAQTLMHVQENRFSDNPNTVLMTLKPKLVFNACL